MWRFHGTHDQLPLDFAPVVDDGEFHTQEVKYAGDELPVPGLPDSEREEGDRE